MPKELTQGEKWKASIITRYGTWDNYVNTTKEWGKKGAYIGKEKGAGFENQSPEKRREAGRKGNQVMRERLKQELKGELN